MKVEDVIKTMNLNQFDALFQTSIQTEFHSTFLGTVALRFEGYEGTLNLEQLVPRVRQAFEEAMEPFVQKIQNNVMFLSRKEIVAYGSLIGTGRNLFTKVQALYKKICEKENSHLVRKCYNSIVENQYNRAHNVGRAVGGTGSEQRHVSYMKEKWFEDFNRLEKGLIHHETIFEEYKAAMKQEEVRRNKETELRRQQEEMRQKAARARRQQMPDDFFQFMHAFFGPFQNERTYTFQNGFYFDQSQFSGASFGPGISGGKPRFNPYKILDVDSKAAPETIKRAYHKAALECHPDKNLDDPKAKQKFQRLEEAYAVLKDPEKRMQYDAYGIIN